MRTCCAILGLASLLLLGALLPLATPAAGQASPLIALTSIGQFTQPLLVTHTGDGTGRLFVVERLGRIRVVDQGQVSTFLDIRTIVRSSGLEQGLLGLAFHPSYASNGAFYVFYTAQNRALTLACYTVSADPNQANPTGVPLLTIPHPGQDNHNGGMLAFGPDGYLYVGVGDGGGQGDPSNNGQSLTTLLGKLLRLQVDGCNPYSIPTSNPFAKAVVGQEIWAYGLRNPWRFSFDRASGDLYIADVGQDTWEEINRQPAGSPGGANYGWRLMEGLHCYNPPSNCNPGGLTLPIFEYRRSSPHCAITGGYVYRGVQVPALSDTYVYGDYCSGTIWGLSATGNAILLDTSLAISSFGEDQAGELYVADLGGGGVYRISAPSAAAPTRTRTPTPTPGAGSPSPTSTAAGPTATPTTSVANLPDLVPISMSVLGTTADQPVVVTVTVANQGKAPAGASFHVHVYDGDPGTGPMLLHLSAEPLGPGQSAPVAGTIDPGVLAAGGHTLWAVVDEHGVVKEANEANNALSHSFVLGPAASPTPMPPIGGRGLSLHLGSAPPGAGAVARGGDATTATLRWLDGTAEDGYRIVRVALSSGGTTWLPSGGALPADAALYVDAGPFPEAAYCHLVVPMSGPTVLGLSDLLCFWPRLASLSSVPGQFTLRLNQTTTATLTWTSPGGQDAYLLWAIPLDGSPIRSLPLEASAVQATDHTTGLPTCYVLLALSGAAVLGNTDVLCGVPGVTTLGIPSSAR